MDLSAYFPIQWNFGNEPTDGVGGPPVNDGGVIYVCEDDDESPLFEEVVLKTSIGELIDLVIDGAKSPQSGKIEDVDSIAIVAAIRGALCDAIKRIDNSFDANIYEALTHSKP